jgi:hypothetical protein
MIKKFRDCHFTVRENTINSPYHSNDMRNLLHAKIKLLANVDRKAVRNNQDGLFV